MDADDSYEGDDVEDLSGSSDENEDVQHDKPKLTKADKKNALLAQHPIVSQFEFYDSLLTARIVQQEILTSVNRLPQLEMYNEFKKTIKNPFNRLVNTAKRTLEETLENLLELQEKLLKVDGIQEGPPSKKRKISGGSGMDEEITSDEDEGSVGGNDKEEEDESESGDEGESEDENESEDDSESGDESESGDDGEGEDDDNEDESDDEEKETSLSENLKKKNENEKKPSNFEEVINKRHKLFEVYRNKLLKELSEKVSFAKVSGSKQGDFKSMHIPINKQISQILEDKERLIEKTRIKRSVYKVLGKKVDQELISSSVDDNEEESLPTHKVERRDKEIFDDGDFYYQLLSEMTNRKAANTNDMMSVSGLWAELNRIKIKKRNVDTKASKGRRTRYTVLKKLVGFMMPDVKVKAWTCNDSDIKNVSSNQSIAENENWMFSTLS